MHFGRRADADTVVAILEQLATQQVHRGICGWTTGPSRSPGRCETGAA